MEIQVLVGHIILIGRKGWLEKKGRHSPEEQGPDYKLWESMVKLQLKSS